MQKNVFLVSRLRLDAQLFKFPEKEIKGKRGRKRIKGDRIRLSNIVEDPTTCWDDAEVYWYGCTKKKVKFFSQTCLWYQACFKVTNYHF